jgi:hypothetical protein
MADINIQKKKGTPLWPILLAVLLIGGIIAAVLLMGRNDDDQFAGAPGATEQDAGATWGAGAGTAGQPGAAGAASAQLQQFRQQCGDTGQFRDQMGVEHQYEADCMRQLADGLDAVISRETVAGQPMQQRVEAFRQRASRITEDPQATEHANRVRGAAQEAAEIIEYVAQNRDAAGADLRQHAQQVREAANRIDAQTVLLQQRERTAAFFARSADALDALDRGRQGAGQQPR